MGVSVSKQKASSSLSEKKSLAIQTDMDQVDFSSVTLNDPRSPSTSFQRTPIQVQLSKMATTANHAANGETDQPCSIRNKHLEKVKTLTEFNSPLNIKMKFVEHATLVCNQIERINNRKLGPKSQKFVTVVERNPVESIAMEVVQGAAIATKLSIDNRKSYLETNLDDIDGDNDCHRIVANHNSDKETAIVVEDVVHDPVQKAIDQMTDNLNDLKMLTLNRPKKMTVGKMNRNDVQKEIEVITIEDTPKKSILNEKVRTPFLEIQSRIPVMKSRKMKTDIVKKKLNVDLDENIENMSEPKSSNITFMEPKPAQWDTNKTLLF